MTKKNTTTVPQNQAGRRRFLGLLATSGAGMMISPSLFAQGEEHQENLSGHSLVYSLPSLQCPTETGIIVVWAVGQTAAGIVEFGTNKDNLDQTAHGEIFGLKPFHERFLQVRIEGLKPNTRYYYRTVTRPFRYVSAYKFESGEPVYGDVYSFETSGAKSISGSFSVINDTHNTQDTLRKLSERLLQTASDYTIWNGDLVECFDGPDVAVETILRPDGSAFAMEKPLLFVPGNHDYRGEWARNIPLVLPTWNHVAPEDRSFGRNFVVRNGPLALIGLDTGEDKPDYRSEWAGLARFEPYRIAQRDWLERALKSRAVATAPFVVAFCHIPLFSDDPEANGGDSAEGFASFQRQASKLWGPLLTKYQVQAVIAAHEHRFYYNPATSDRSWAQIQGGAPRGQVTVIHGKAEGKLMEIVVDDINSGKELGRWMFQKRKV